MQPADVHALIATPDKQAIQAARIAFKSCRVVPDLQLLERLLERFQQEFHVIKRTRLGVEARPDVLLLDISMPGLDGGFVQRLTAEASHLSRVPVIMLSGLGKQPQQDELLLKLGRALSSHALEYVFKPLRAPELLLRFDLLSHKDSRAVEPPPLQAEPLFAHLVEQLHAPDNGRLDARRVAEFFALPLAEIARLIGRGVSTVHKTSDAHALQADLRPFERIASALARLTGSPERARKWLHAPSPALDGHAPVEMLQKGELAALEAFLQDLLEGRPA